MIRMCMIMIMMFYKQYIVQIEIEMPQMVTMKRTEQLVS